MSTKDIIGCAIVGLIVNTVSTTFAEKRGFENGYAARTETAYVESAVASQATPLAATEGIIGADRKYHFTHARMQVGSEPKTVSYELIKQFEESSLESIVDILQKRAQFKQPVTIYTTELKGQTYLVKIDVDGKEFGLKYK